VIVPSFGDARDEEALAIIATRFPGREAVSLPGHEVILNGGCFHCITQQQPRGRQDP
jgi:agmatine deiminase